ncbi:TSUP family transporter [Nocardioides taihuensis]|uniref:Probable membrane transporter protein n=1 Tax=Nocardioides taihuensis TaxID=1835606 RepID=A0ABW0BQC9_9ACTN
MTLVTGLVAVAAGLLIGLSLGALGSGGSILAVPVLVHLLGQSPIAATTGSLVVVGATALVAAVATRPSGTVRVGRGLAFGAAATGGAVVGSRLALRTPGDVLLLAFSALLLVVALAMLVRSHRRRGLPAEQRPADVPIITLRPFTCACPRALKVLVAATVTGLLTGFLGVGGGFLVVPALVLSLGLEVAEAAGTSLVVIVATSAVALLARLPGDAPVPDWGIVLVLTAAAVVGALAGVRTARRTDPRRLSQAFIALLLGVAVASATAVLA